MKRREGKGISKDNLNDNNGTGAQRNKEKITLQDGLVVGVRLQVEFIVLARSCKLYNEVTKKREEIK